MRNSLETVFKTSVETNFEWDSEDSFQKATSSLEADAFNQRFFIDLSEDGVTGSSKLSVRKDESTICQIVGRRTSGFKKFDVVIETPPNTAQIEGQFDTDVKQIVFHKDKADMNKKFGLLFNSHKKSVTIEFPHNGRQKSIKALARYEAKAMEATVIFDVFDSQGDKLKMNLNMSEIGEEISRLTISFTSEVRCKYADKNSSKEIAIYCRKFPFFAIQVTLILLA